MAGGEGAAAGRPTILNTHVPSRDRIAVAYARLYPQLQELDLREQVPALDVPFWIVIGQHEARGRVEPAQEWFESLEAPEKHWVEFEASSHPANFERPAEYARLLDEIETATGNNRQ